MLGWLRGAPRSETAVNAVPPEAGGDITCMPDAPETPAPVFAIRAFKTALFGTPHDTENIDESPTPGDEVYDRTSRSSGAGAKFVPSMAAPDRSLYSSSPTKPAGILLTPGTASNRRKTVSFGAAVIDNEAGGRSGLPSNLPGKYPSPWTPKATTPGSRRARTSLTNTLYEVRNTTSTNTKLVKGKAPRRKNPGTDLVEGLGGLDAKNAVGEFEPDLSDSGEEGDITVDLNKPRSRSGRYWKTEYDQYQEKTDHEMKKLVKYKYLARSYAKKKDSEAVELGNKLREERKKVVEMEEKISELAAQMAASRVHGDGNGTDQSSEIVKGLARQTALAVEYKEKVDRFQAALEQHGIPIEQESLGTKKLAIPQTEHTLIQVGQELKRAREQLREINLLQLEVEELRSTLKGAELKAQKLDEEKLSLSKDLEKAKEELERNDKRRIAREEKHKQREEKLVTQKNEYKERLLQAKADHQVAGEKLKKRSSDERANFEQETSNLRDRLRISTKGDFGALGKLEQQCFSQQEAIKDYERQIEDLRAAAAKSHGSTDRTHDEWQQQQRKTLRELRQAREEVSNMRLERDAVQTELRDCQAEIERLKTRHQPPKQGESAARLPKPKDRGSYDPSDKHYKLHSAAEVSSIPAARGWPSANRASLPNAALLDLSHNPNHENQNRMPGLQSPERTPGSARRRGRRYSLDSPSLALPSPEAFTSRTTHGQSKTYDSPRPSFFSIPSSPPKMQPLTLPLRTTAAPPPPPSRPSAGTGVRRTESLRVAKTRSSLPPERAAAAKARLEQRNAEKRLRDKAPQKENMVPGVDMREV
ncbi:hypothetical protein FGG08_004805 [Glutinoglossum americanum]|uniref:Spindle pole body-associated protein cut12 domain-containing protein n=1 Tax=Glutinoglossum americanum TaxID=1670608 RepID=A0A9P8L3J1_9PEZI|nr:hypothetical protein FGG08_004805 [Glutinoglossum americanum]